MNNPEYFLQDRFFYVPLHPVILPSPLTANCSLLTLNINLQNPFFMINNKLISPKSIVICGASSDIHKPGGKALKNLLESAFKGEVYAVNPKEDEVQGIKCYKQVEDLPQVDCAILCIAAKFCAHTVDVLTQQKGTQGFIIVSAGFSEENAEGAAIEKHIVDAINAVGGSLIGPTAPVSSTPTIAAASTPRSRNSTPRVWISSRVAVPPLFLSRNTA